MSRRRSSAGPMSLHIFDAASSRASRSMSSSIFRRAAGGNPSYRPLFTTESRCLRRASPAYSWYMRCSRMLSGICEPVTFGTDTVAGGPLADALHGPGRPVWQLQAILNSVGQLEVAEFV